MLWSGCAQTRPPAHRPECPIPGRRRVTRACLNTSPARFFDRMKQVAELRPVVGRGIGDLVESVFDLRREADRAVARQRPGRGCPDHDRRARCHEIVGRRRCRSRFAADSSSARVTGNFTQTVSLVIVLVLDLGFGERGLLHHAPHHRLGAAIERAVLRELHQLARDLRLGRKAHRGVGMVPVALDAEPLELLALHVQPVLGIGAAFARGTRSSRPGRRGSASACSWSGSSLPRSSIRSAGRGSPSPARSWNRSRASAGCASPRP